MEQPLLHDGVVVIAAPAQVWSRTDGGMDAGADGCTVSDVRVLSGHRVAVAGTDVEHIATHQEGASVRFTALLRGLDGPGADPRVRLDVLRTATPDGMRERLRVTSALDTAVELDLALELDTESTPMPAIKAGFPAQRTMPTVGSGSAGWGVGAVHATLHADGLELRADGEGLQLLLRATLAPRSAVEADWWLAVRDADAVVAAPPARVPIGVQPSGDTDLDAWLARAAADIEALQLVLPQAPEDVFAAAGAPWFFTLFGRDAIWTARLLLPTALPLAAGTLRVLARLQGTHTDDETAERPGGVLHELRREVNPLAGGVTLPPRYYGSIDATPLWILLLHDAWRAGLTDHELADLVPALGAALAWLRDAVPGDGFLSYSDPGGHGLANQGWKDSGDSVQWADGRLARGPIALVEVQGYAHEAALAAVVLLRALGDDAEADAWTAWAAALKARFRDAFWVEGPDGGHPAIALDADGAAVDSLTSNIGHLLGTGILDAADEARVAELLVDPRLDSGLGLRTLATDAAGYWPLSYHGGSVWAHDTAIAIRGLTAAGFGGQARTLAAGLLAAARAFDFRMPELHAGDARHGGDAVPYPAACRPQAWSAAAAFAVATALTSAPETIPSEPQHERH